MSSVELLYVVPPRTRDLLIESAPLIEEWSEEECRSKAGGGMEEWAKSQAGTQHEVETCSWYHGTWQYLRLLNMVAVPSWHDLFFNRALTAVLKRTPRAKVLISAAADYGMLATLHEAIEAVSAHPRIAIYDICQTPLKASQWYADRHGLAIACVCGNLLTAEVREAPFDLIVTDEFLSVVKAADKPRVVRRWKELLAPGGTVVTTAMIGGPTAPPLRRAYAERAQRHVEADGVAVPAYQDGQKEALIRRCTRFADLHTRHMIGSEDEVRGLFSTFASVWCRCITTPGECVTPTDSVQIVATTAS